MNTENQFQIKSVIVIPTYNETDSLVHFLHKLLPLCSITVAIIICDDSNSSVRSFVKNLVNKLGGQFKNVIIHDFVQYKGGRGSAVIRGFRKALDFFPNAEHFIECDADDSHQVEDILKIINEPRKLDFIIGSRYLLNSKIEGWPISRRVFSKMLNLVIPRVLAIKTTDATNGLRRYSRNAVQEILKTPLKTRGFITLSEIALKLRDSGIHPTEVSTTFVNRKIGESTVTLREIMNSAFGLITLIIGKK